MKVVRPRMTFLSHASTRKIGPHRTSSQSERAPAITGALIFIRSEQLKQSKELLTLHRDYLNLNQSPRSSQIRHLHRTPRRLIRLILRSEELCIISLQR